MLLIPDREVIGIRVDVLAHAPAGGKPERGALAAQQVFAETSAGVLLLLLPLFPQLRICLSSQGKPSIECRPRLLP
jgi:hypothetical protein